MLKKLLTTLGVLIFIGAAIFAVRTFTQRRNDNELLKNPTSTKTQQPIQSTFNKKKYSNDDPMSVWVVVNKHRPLIPTSFAPNDLVTPAVPLRVPGNESMQVRKVTGNALETMFTAAKKDGLSLMLSSGYRSYQFQTSLYNSYVNNSSIAEADKTSARPSYSEHQTGLAADIEPFSQKCDVDPCFATTPEGIWLAANAYKYGFIIRYTSDKIAITGYSPEAWHIRYIGMELSNEMHRLKIETLEEFFGLGAAAGYSS